MKHLQTLLTALALTAPLTSRAQTTEATYTNPIISTSLPDPTITRADDGMFYLYATEDIHNLPIYRSANLIDWTFVGTAFNDQTRPQWNPQGGIWAPDINRIGPLYVLYYSKSVWGGEWDCGIGVATATKPEGPFTDHGKLFISREIGVQNCIDPFFISDDGHNYLFWGSFHGIYGIELTADGLAIKPGAEKRKVAGNFMEGTYIHKRGSYYYLFGSAGSCCEGAKSTYRVTVGRSKNLFGPYVDREGQLLTDDHFTTVVHANKLVYGPGHNAEIVTDNLGRDYMPMHGYPAADPDAGRVTWLVRINWRDGWPETEGSSPAATDVAPSFDALHLADPTIVEAEGRYWLYGTDPDSGDGFRAYTSTDLKHWTGPVGQDFGFVLRGNNAHTYGTTGFWAPQVFAYKGRYAMVYTANEHIAVAWSQSPAGPFRQDEARCIATPMKAIDPYVFFDRRSGKTYLYHVRLTQGNRIYVAELSDDLTSIDESTARECVSAEKGWEDTQHAPWRVCEGPTVVEQDGTYYMFFSCNDFRNPDYAVGYATAKSPLGPWKKQKQPLISRALLGVPGTGHGDLLHTADGRWLYVLHTHNSATEVSPRRTAIVELQLKGKKWSLVEGSFHYLEK